MLKMTRAQLEEMVQHVRNEAPNEGCGMLGGKDGRVLKVFPARNALASPIRYSIEPHDLLQIVRTVDEQGWDIVGIFHSHVASRAYPSLTDVAEAEIDFGNGQKVSRYPGAVHVIISLADPARPDVRGYEIHDGHITEVPLVIETDKLTSVQTAQHGERRRLWHGKP